MPSRKGTIVGYALGGGSARGLAHIGVLKALENHGIFPDVVAGTSMGAVIGALYCGGLRARDIEELAKSLNTLKLAYLLDVTLPKSGLFQGKGVMALLDSILGNMTFEKADPPFACVATDLMTGGEVVFKEGRIAEAVRASIAIPGVLTPVCLDTKCLVDGGLVNAVPVSVCRNLGATYVIAVNVVPPPQGVLTQTEPVNIKGAVRLGVANNNQKAKPLGIIDIMAQTLHIAEYHVASENIKGADLVISPDTTKIGVWHFTRVAEAVTLGESAAEAALLKAGIALSSRRSPPAGGVVGRIESVLGGIETVRKAVSTMVNRKS